MYNIRQERNGEFTIRRYKDEEFTDVRPEEIEDEILNLNLIIHDRLPFDLSRKRIKHMYVRNSEIDLSDPYLPRKVNTLALFGCCLTGRFDRPMDVRDLRMTRIIYIENINGFKNFFKNVNVFSADEIPELYLFGCIPFSAKKLSMFHRFSFAQLDELIARHPNCCVVSVDIPDFESGKAFLTKHRYRLHLSEQKKAFTFRHFSRDADRLFQYMDRLITEDDKYNAHRVLRNAVPEEIQMHISKYLW